MGMAEAWRAARLWRQEWHRWSDIQGRIHRIQITMSELIVQAMRCSIFSLGPSTEWRTTWLLSMTSNASSQEERKRVLTLKSKLKENNRLRFLPWCFSKRYLYRPKQSHHKLLFRGTNEKNSGFVWYIAIVFFPSDWPVAKGTIK